MEEKGIDVKEDILKNEETSEAFVNSLPTPEAMPLNKGGKVIDTRIPIDLKPSEKSKSLDFLLNLHVSFHHKGSIENLSIITWFVVFVKPGRHCSSINIVIITGGE